MNIKYILRRPARGTGNAGMETPYDQGFNAGAGGKPYDQPYDQPGEETDAQAYSRGWRDGTTSRDS